MKLFLLISALICLAPACKRQIAVDDIENLPIASAADSSLANVYRSLDGTWTGEFEIFRDDNRVPKDEALMYNPTTLALTRQNVNSIQVIRVKQVYESISPYFQKVTIQDTYMENGNTVTSQGVNKIQDGKMWCVVRKPDETVIHEGSMDGAETIIWQRNETNPQKIEYFKESVSENRYTILGWGYYDGDDPTLMPRYWFYGIYRKK